MTTAPTVDGFLRTVRLEIDQCLKALASIIPAQVELDTLVSGKLLRSRLVARLAAAALPPFDARHALAAAVATELVHSASLCHDDIIDDADRRRGRPTVWRRVGVPGAILVGDLLLVESFRVIAAVSGPAAASFAAALNAVCAAEMDQELRHRWRAGDLARWEATCRGKTGALFAFPARWVCPHQPALASALEEAGALVGTAWQMFDDLLDKVGDAAAVGKTLGTDASRGKHTIPAIGQAGVEVALSHIDTVFACAIAALGAWPRARQAVADYVELDMRPRMAVVRPCALAALR